MLRGKHYFIATIK